MVYGATLVVLLRLDLQTGATATVHRAVRGLMRLPAVQSALCAAIAFYLTIGMFEALWSVLLRDLGAETRGGALDPEQIAERDNLPAFKKTSVKVLLARAEPIRA